MGNKPARAPRGRKRILLGLLVVFSVALLWCLFVCQRIAAFGRRDVRTPSDAAIVLGAAVADGIPSPVFRERIRHAVDLYRRGTVRKIVFTGGVGRGSAVAESEAARAQALAAGVPGRDILVERQSHTTLQNLAEAKKLLSAGGLRTALLVSDPLHMRRAMLMAEDLGLQAVPSPTPTTRYRSTATRAGFLLRELYFIHQYRILGR